MPWVQLPQFPSDAIQKHRRLRLDNVTIETSLFVLGCNGYNFVAQLDGVLWGDVDF